MAAKKKAKGVGQPKRYGTLIRVSDEFSEAIQEAASFEKLSVAAYAATYLLPVIQKQYREAFLRKAKRMEGKG